MSFNDYDAIANWPDTHGLRQRFVRSADGTRLRVVESGPREGPMVLLLHGAPQMALCWTRVIEALGPDIRVAAPDLRGMGHSDLSATGRYDMATLQQDMDCLMGLGDGAPVLPVGHDWGGVILWAYLARVGRAVPEAVLMNAPHGPAFAHDLQRWEQFKKSWYILAFQVPGIERVVEGNLDEFVHRAFLRQNPDLFPASDITLYRQSLARLGRVKALLGYYRSAAKNRREFPNDGRIVSRVQLLWGDQDQALSAQHTKTVAPYCDQLEVIPLPGVGHWVPEERPDEVAAAIRKGLARLDTGQQSRQTPLSLQFWVPTRGRRLPAAGGAQRAKTQPTTASSVKPHLRPSLFPHALRHRHLDRGRWPRRSLSGALLPTQVRQVCVPAGS